MEKDTEKRFNENQVEGRNAVLEVFKSGRDIEKIIVAKGNTEGNIRRIMSMAAEKGVVLQQVERRRLDEMSQTKNHQGVIAIVSSHSSVDVGDILDRERQKDKDTFVNIL